MQRRAGGKRWPVVHEMQLVRSPCRNSEIAPTRAFPPSQKGGWGQGFGVAQHPSKHIRHLVPTADGYSCSGRWQEKLSNIFLAYRGRSSVFAAARLSIFEMPALCHADQSTTVTTEDWRTNDEPLTTPIFFLKKRSRQEVRKTSSSQGFHRRTPIRTHITWGRLGS